MKTKIAKWFGILLIGLTGCYDYSNFDNIAIDPITTSFIFPIINDSISIREILEKSDSISLVQENPDHSFSLLFRDTINAGYASDQVTIPNQSFDYTLTVPGLPPTPIVIPNQTFSFDQVAENSIKTTFEAGAVVELKGIDFSSGTINIHMVNNFHHSVAGRITFSSLIDKQNHALIFRFNLSDYGTFKDTTINLIDYHLDSYYPASNAYNYFFYRVEGTLTTLSNPVNVGDNVSIQVSAVNPVFSRVTGKIKYSFVLDNQSFNVDLFPTNINVQQHLEDPRLNLTFLNSFGIPLAATFTQFRLNNKQNLPFNLVSSRSQTNDLQMPNIANTIPAIKRVNQVDTAKIYSINRDNSNISSAFDITPSSAEFGTQFDFGDNSDNHDYFINYGSTVKLITEAEIPIYGWATISMTDSVAALDLPKLDSISNIDVQTADIRFSLKILNSIPFDIYLQVAFINEAVPDTTWLFENKVEEQLIKSPTVGVDGTSNQIASKTTVIAIEKDRYDLISHATKMKIFFRFALGNVGQSVKVLSTDKLRIKANFFVSGTYKPKL